MVMSLSAIDSQMLVENIGCHRFTDAGGEHRILGSETMGSSLITAITVTSVSALTPVSKPVSLG